MMSVNNYPDNMSRGVGHPLHPDTPEEKAVCRGCEQYLDVCDMHYDDFNEDYICESCRDIELSES